MHNRIITYYIFFLLLMGFSFSAAGDMLINKTYGGTASDYVYSVQQTSDGGYILAGNSESFGAGGDAWVVKANSTGGMQWNKTYGGTGGDYSLSVQQTSDSGYVLGGYYAVNSTNADAWLIKTNSTGGMQWNRTYGGTRSDQAKSVQQTSDGGYIFGGNYGVTPTNQDVYLVKTNSTGGMQWSKTYGGTVEDYANSVQQTSDGGYILAAWTNSFGAGSWDFWLIKTDSTGTMQWNKTYGGTGWDQAYSVQQTSDGGYILAGFTASFGAGSWDFWLIKTNSTGGMQWNKTYGGTGVDQAKSVQQTSDNGYILAGYTASFGAGGGDIWLIKTNSTGGMQWNKTYGGTGYEESNSVQQTSDGNYVIAGYTASFGAGSGDFWLVKVDSGLSPIISGLPNASSFISTYGSTNFSAVPDLNNVTNLTLATQTGKIKFAENCVINATGQDYDSQVVIGNGFISVNSSGLNPSFNNSATLTLNNVSCPATVYYASGFFNSSGGVLAQKNICNSTTDPSCTNITCSGGNLAFMVSHFTGFAYGATANLTIWDETDSGVQYANQIRYIGQNIRFFANYSNSTSEPITGATCQIWFSDSGWNAMSWNNTNLYEYTRSFSSGGSFNWNVSCNKSGQATLDANDTVLVNSTIAVVLNSPADNAIVKSSIILYNWTPYGFPGDPSCNLTRNGSVVYSATCTNNAICGYTNTTANGAYVWNVTCNSGATTRTSSTRALTVNTLYHSTNVEGVLNMNITEITSISLPQNTISFGTVEITQTYDSYPSQFFVIKNDGNTIVDIEVNATNPFLSTNCSSLPCSAYQVKVGANETIPYPICSGNPSKESYTNMFGSTSGLLINDLNFVDNDDSANIYIKFRLPNDEPPGSKPSTVTFWAKSAGSYACN